ncbi:hypothetical protein MGAST_09145 [Mycobacterium gastri 'Wayne']|nr:hypothetical protein MGAST_09145 [Mycobacterium gastri 'Wayne']
MLTLRLGGGCFQALSSGSETGTTGRDDRLHLRDALLERGSQMVIW